MARDAQRAALAVAALLICLSLVFNPGGRNRKVLVLLMFVAVFTAICFQAMIFSPMPITAAHAAFAEIRLTDDIGFYVALVPTIIAGVLCLVRMIWTMTGPSKTLPAEPCSRASVVFRCVSQAMSSGTLSVICDDHSPLGALGVPGDMRGRARLRRPVPTSRRWGPSPVAITRRITAKRRPAPAEVATFCGSASVRIGCRRRISGSGALPSRPFVIGILCVGPTQRCVTPDAALHSDLGAACPGRRDSV